jgi:hypothetical protein
VELWNFGILEEGTHGRDERLLFQGTQTRAPSRAMEGHALSWPIPAVDAAEHVPPDQPFHLSKAGDSQSGKCDDKSREKETP